MPPATPGDLLGKALEIGGSLAPPAHRQLARSTLEQAGFEIVEADDGAAALKLALAGTFELLVLDVVMPRMNGLDVIKMLRAKLRAVSAESVPIATHRGLGYSWTAKS